MEVGVTLEFAKEEYFKRLCNKDIFEKEVTDKFVGKVKVLKSSASCSNEEMTMAIDRFRRWGAENGIYMPSPEDEQILKDIEIEMGRIKSFIG